MIWVFTQSKRGENKWKTSSVTGCFFPSVSLGKSYLVKLELQKCTDLSQKCGMEENKPLIFPRNLLVFFDKCSWDLQNYLHALTFSPILSGKFADYGIDKSSDFVNFHRKNGL